MTTSEAVCSTDLPGSRSWPSGEREKGSRSSIASRRSTACIGCSPNLAEARPCVLLVDDGPWADTESIRWLDFVARRAPDIPAAVVAAVRSGEPGEPAELEDLRADSHIFLRPATLSPTAQEDLARTWFDEAPSDEVLAACDAASGGNPFLLEQLLRTLRAEDIGPRDPASVTAIEAIAPD